MNLARIDIQQATLFDVQELIADIHEQLKREEELEHIHQLSGDALDECRHRLGQDLINLKKMLPHGRFIPVVQSEFGMSQSTAWRHMELVKQEPNHAPAHDLGWSVEVELISAPEPVIKMVESGEIKTRAEIREAKRNVDNIPIAVPHISSKNNEWYTPAKYIEAAKELMGGIDTDPASCDLANKVVQASRYYDKNGLNQSWHGRVWLNPPYGFDGGTSNQELWSRTLIERYKAGLVAEAVLLVNAAVDTKWFHRLFDYPVCLTLGRINFSTPEPVANGSTHGSAFVYFGPKSGEFVKIFSEFGTVVKRWQ